MYIYIDIFLHIHIMGYMMDACRETDKLMNAEIVQDTCMYIYMYIYVSLQIKCTLSFLFYDIFSFFLFYHILHIFL